jgi:hypothetical protein
MQKTGVEVGKYISLLHNIIKDVEGLHDSSSKDCDSLDANDSIQFKKSRLHNSVTASGKQTRNLFCGFFNIPAGSVLCQEEATGDVHKPIQMLCNSTY